MIPDDPLFIHNMDYLPPFNGEDSQLVDLAGHNTIRASTPWDADLVYDSLVEKLSQPETPRSGASSQLVLPSSGFQSIGFQQENEDDLLGFHDDKELRTIDDWGLDIDADGNVIERNDEDLELPVLPREARDQENEGVPVMDEDGDIPMVFDNAATAQSSSQQPAEGERPIGVANNRVIVAHRRRRLVPLMAPDAETTVPKPVILAWPRNYVADQDKIRLDRIRRAFRAGPTPTQAKKNGFNFVFGLGIGGVGVLPPSHPLANLFAGDNLAHSILGLDPDGQDNEEDAVRPPRRKANDDADADRRVRPRLEEGTPIPGTDNLELEIGRKSSQALPDIPSDVPWMPPSSSAIKNKGKGREVDLSSQASPIRVRGSSIIDRHSDQPLFGEDVDFPFPSMQSSQNPFAGPSGSQSQPSANTHDPLGHEGRSFLGYIEKVVVERGLPDADTGVTWAEFDDLVGPGRKREAAVMAFRIVLLLATRDTIKVQQPGGNIRVGLKA